jgi:hypothetical protein
LKQGCNGLKVHTVDGEIFVTSDKRGSSYRTVSLDWFEPRADYSQIYVLGSLQTAQLISGLLARKQAGQVTADVLIGSIGQSRRGRVGISKSPVAVFRHMEELEYGSSGNGWHIANEFDQATYEFLAMCPTLGAIPAKVPLAQLEAHPAWRALAFLQEVNFAAILPLLQAIVDPRWYFDSATGEIMPSLLKSFGLARFDKATVRRVDTVLTRPEVAREIYTTHSGRILATLTAWHGEIPLTGTKPDAAFEISEQPHRYFLRCALSEECWAAGCLLACQRFLEFLCATWLDAITPRRELFVPQYFFKDDHAALEAWRETDPSTYKE